MSLIPEGQKTYFVKTVKENIDRLFSEKIDSIVYVYSCWQPTHGKLLKIRSINFLEGIPKSLGDDSNLPTHTRKLLIIDDLMNDACNDLEVKYVFTKYVS